MSTDDMQEFGESKVGQPADDLPDYENCEECGMLLHYPEERTVGFCLGCQWKEDQEDDDVD